MGQPWFMYPVCVPFGNPNYDSALGGSHDLDIGAPPNYEVTSIVSGVLASITSPPPAWGKQVGIRLDHPINGKPYFAFLHLSAVNPHLVLNQRVELGTLIGWVGGGNSDTMYQGTSNPTGHNFINTAEMSSRIQVGIALMNGPEYGLSGWEKFPPIDWGLDPTPLLYEVRKKYSMSLQPGPEERAAFEQEWLSLVPTGNVHSGIANAAWEDYQLGHFHGPPLKGEEDGKDWNGQALKVQRLAGGRYEWANGQAHYYPYV